MVQSIKPCTALRIHMHCPRTLTLQFFPPYLCMWVDKQCSVPYSAWSCSPGVSGTVRHHTMQPAGKAATRLSRLIAGCLRARGFSQGLRKQRAGLARSMHAPCSVNHTVPEYTVRRRASMPAGRGGRLSHVSDHFYKPCTDINGGMRVLGHSSLHMMRQLSKRCSLQVTMKPA